MGTDTARPPAGPSQATIPAGAIPVLDHGFVRMVDAMADDLSVVNAARVSFVQERENVGVYDDRRGDHSNDS